MTENSRDNSARQEGPRQPFVQFFPADWRGDLKLRACSLAARGLWIEMIGIMHESTEPGFLLINGKPPTINQLAAQVGISAAKVRKALEELRENDVFSSTESGIIFSRKMARKWSKSVSASEAARKRWDAENKEQSQNDAPANAYAKSMPPARVRDRDLIDSESQRYKSETPTAESRANVVELGAGNYAEKFAALKNGSDPFPVIIEETAAGRFAGTPEGREREAWFLAKAVLSVFEKITTSAAGAFVKQAVERYKLDPNELSLAALAVYQTWERTGRMANAKNYFIGCCKSAAENRRERG